MKHMVKGLALSAMAIVGFALTSLAESTYATTIYVDGSSTAEPAEPYGEGAPAKSIKVAVTYASGLATEAFPVEIVVKKGTYTETDMTLSKAITVRGETGDPKDVEIVDNVKGKRAFTISHADALVQDLTISGYYTGAGQRATGGHIYMSAGTVRHCVIKDGHLHHYARGCNIYMTNGLVEDCLITGGSPDGTGSGSQYGGNVFMSGGRLVRCQVLRGYVCDGIGADADYARGGGVYASGGVIESCVIGCNRADYGSYNGAVAAGIYLDGPVTLANSAVINNVGNGCKYAGIYVNNAGARVVNTIIYGNGVSQEENLGLATYCGIYTNCAMADVSGLSDTCKVAHEGDFASIRNGDFKLAFDSPLKDAGTTDDTIVPAGVLADGAKDVAGSVRQSGATIDIGPYEVCDLFDAHVVGPGGYVNKPTTFVATASQGTTFEWDFGDGSSPERTQEAQVAHAYAARGHYTVTVKASSDGGETWFGTKTLFRPVTVVPEFIYVDASSASPTAPYDTKETAAHVFSEALSVLKEGVPYDDWVFGTIVVPQGKTATGGESLEIRYPITICGETGNPADAVINDAVAKQYAFSIKHPWATVSGLTISGNRGSAGNGCVGGHVLLYAGTVTNCAIKGGYLPHYAYGGNLYMTGGLVVDSTLSENNIVSGCYGVYGGNVYMGGGRLLRCVLDKSSLQGKPGGSISGKGGAIYASGGIVENCLIKGTVSSGTLTDGAGIYLAGGATVVNCTVAGGSSESGVAGIAVASGNAKIVNTVIYGNGGGTKEIGTANPQCFQYCASSVENESDEHWQVVADGDFEDFANGLYAPKAGSKLVDNATMDQTLVPASVLAADALDVLLQKRKSGASLDIGAYEFDQSQVSGELLDRGGIVGQPVSFKASVGHEPGDTVVYRWKFGDSDQVVESQTETCAHTYESRGIYTVQVAAVVNGTEGGWKTLSLPVVVVPAKIYVNKLSENPQEPYDTPATAAHTFREAFNVMTNVNSAGAPYFGTIVIPQGGQVDGGESIELKYPITIRGETDDPADAVINDAVKDKHAFTIRGAVVIANLTIQGTRAATTWANAGHLDMSAGTVTNCVIKGGYLDNYGCGGNVYMTGGTIVDSTITGGKGGGGYGNWGANVYMTDGLLLRCQIADARLNSANGGSKRGWGAGIYASGGAVVNCLVKGNATTGYEAAGGGIYLAGGATVVNCTVVGNACDTGIAGIAVTSADAKIVNTVIYGNGGGTKEIGTANPQCFQYCASSVENAFDEHWQVVSDDDFEDVANGLYAPKAGSKLVNHATMDSTLVPADLLAVGAVDIAGGARKSGAAIDIGAYELDLTVVFGELLDRGGIVGQPVSFKATVEHEPGDTVVYRWKFGDSDQVVETPSEAFTHAYQKAGIYTVQVAASVNGVEGKWKTLALPVVVVPEKIYVNKLSENPQEPYDTPEKAAHTFREAFNVMTNVNSAGEPYFGTIVIPQGGQVDGGQNLEIKYPITIRGETDDPADAVINDAVANMHAFTLKGSAVIANLTIQGTRTASTGVNAGHLEMSDGTVTNCVIRDGCLSHYGCGGNVYMTGGLVVDSTIAENSQGSILGMHGGGVCMSGGRLLRCQILNSRLTGKSGGSSSVAPDGRGGGIYASGGSIEGCLVKGSVGTGDKTYGTGIYLAGGATVVNCTVVGGSSESGVAGIDVASADAKVVNTVIYGNGGGTKEIGTANPQCFQYCASSVENAFDEHWQVVSDDDFEDVANGLYAPKAGSKLVDNATMDQTLVPADLLAVGAVDIAGGVRKSGASLDIGAYELDQSVASGELLGRGGIAGKSVAFKASVGHEPGDTVVYRWKFGDSDQVFESASETCVHAYDNPGLYAVQVAAVVNGVEGKWKTLALPVVVVPEKIYVNKLSENPQEPYDTPEKAAHTFREAFNVMTNVNSAGAPYFGTIVIPKGGQADGGQSLEIRYPITIRGETDDPADAEIIDNVKDKRAFTLSNAGAVLANLTISGTPDNGSYSQQNWWSDYAGGHIKMTDGLVSNCVVKSGKLAHYTGGGNIAMSGGTVIDSQILDGNKGVNRCEPRGGNIYLRGGRLARSIISGGWAGDASGMNGKGGGVYAEGGVVENCLIYGNGASSVATGAGVYLAGGATVVNCTVVGNSGGVVSGIAVASGDAKIVNTVIYGNGDTLALNVGTANTNKLDFCATAFEGLSDTCKTIDESAFKSYAKWLEAKDPQHIEFLAPAKGKTLQNGGCKAKDYPATGAVSEKDVLGRNRISGKRVDIGALEVPNACSYILIR